MYTKKTQKTGFTSARAFAFLLGSLFLISSAEANPCRKYFSKERMGTMETLRQLSFSREGVEALPVSINSKTAKRIFDFLTSVAPAGQIDIRHADDGVHYTQTTYPRRDKVLVVEHEPIAFESVTTLIQSVIDEIGLMAPGESFYLRGGSMTWNLDGFARKKVGPKHVDDSYITVVIPLMGEGTWLSLSKGNLQSLEGLPVAITGSQRARKTGISATWHQAPDSKSPRLFLQLIFEAKRSI